MFAWLLAAEGCSLPRDCFGSGFSTASRSFRRVAPASGGTLSSAGFAYFQSGDFRAQCRRT
jgi:hypothetical protein